MIIEDSKPSNVNYNDEPVFYCRHCMSLCVKTIEGEDYCDVCGSTDIDQAHIEYWKNECIKRLGKTLY